MAEEVEDAAEGLLEGEEGEEGEEEEEAASFLRVE